MKPAEFEYHRPRKIEDALSLLTKFGQEGKILAGGQSLMPLMNFRLAQPAHLVDINFIDGLDYIKSENGSVKIGCLARQSRLLNEPLIRQRCPLLAEALAQVGYEQTRNRGTLCGSLAHADPAAELPLIAVTLDAVMTYRGGGADAEVTARDFFTGLMTTSLPAGACLTAVRFPVWHGESRVGVGFHEVNARRSDFAFVAAAAQVALDESGKAKRIAIGIGAATDVPLRLDAAERQLTGGALDEPKVMEAVRGALAGREMLSDLHASAEYRRRAAVTLAARAVADAKANALRSKARAH